MTTALSRSILGVAKQPLEEIAMVNPPHSVEGVFLKNWNGAITNAGRDAVLIVQFTDGRSFGIQMPAQTAREMGAGLSDIGNQTAPPADAKPN